MNKDIENKIQREKLIFEFVQSLAFNITGMEDNSAFSVFGEEKKNNKQSVNNLFLTGFENYFCRDENNREKNLESEETKLNVGLFFMKEIVKIHGTDDDVLQAAVVAVADYFSESNQFTAKLMQSTLGTKEYKEEFEKEQNKEEEEIISLVRNNEI